MSTRAAFFLLLSFATIGVATIAVASEPIVEIDDLPVAGPHHTAIELPSFGRYSFEVTSPSGTAISVVDRMSGPTATYGAIGIEDGRLDVFAEAGDVLVRTEGALDATGTAKLTVTPSQEANAPIPRLPRLRQIDTELDDHQERSYWLDIQTRELVIVEAAGRHLTDLRLWQDGGWLVDASPTCTVTEPRSGRPLWSCLLVSRLDPGLYKLTAYGGPEQTWSDDDGTRPLYLRRDVPHLTSAGRRHDTVSPFGHDHYRLSAPANYVRLSLPRATDARLEIRSWNDDTLFDRRRGQTARITKESSPPIAELRSNDNERVVTVSGQADQAYVLDFFDDATQHRITETGRHWLSTVHAGDARDRLDTTAILIAHPNRGNGRIQDTRVVELGPGRGWARRTNVLGTVTLFFAIEQAGRYRVAIDDAVPVTVRVEPFFLRPPENYRPPTPRGNDSTWDLARGLFVLTVDPSATGGVTSLTLHAENDPPPEARDQPTMSEARFPTIQLEPRTDYLLVTNATGAPGGIQLRPLPLDADRAPLAITLAPGEIVSLPVRQGEPGHFTIPTSTPIALSRDGAIWQTSTDTGTTLPSRVTETVWLRNDGDREARADLRFTPLDRLEETPLAPLPDEALAAIPTFPRLEDGKTLPVDLDSQTVETFQLDAYEPALYRIETTGLLDTFATIRTRATPRLATADGGGSGRNLALQTYLRPGAYQVSLRTNGPSAGRAGLTASRTTLRDGGRLDAQHIARGTTTEDEAVAYQINIEGVAGERPDRYRLQVLSSGKPTLVRLEDAEGWPQIAPVILADREIELDAGSYRLIVLPSSVPTRHIARLETVRDTPRFSGHGPHALPLDTTVEHRWLEPREEGAERTPDQWRFDLGAPATTTVTLDGEMAGTLVPLDGQSDAVAIPPGRGWRGELAAGSWRLDTVCSRINHGAVYTVGVRTDELLPGRERDVDVPVSIPVSVGRQSLVELSSFGGADVRATLVDREGAIVARADDRANDWNFLIAETLEPGRYRLDVEPVGTSQARVAVRMATRGERVETGLGLGRDLTVIPGDDVLRIGLSVDNDDDLLLIRASSTEPLGASLLTQGDSSNPQALTTQTGNEIDIMVALDRQGRYELLLWSLDSRGGEATIRAETVAVPRHAVTSASGRVSTSRFLFAGRTYYAARLSSVDCLRLSEGARVGLAGETLRVADPLVWAATDLMVVAPGELVAQPQRFPADGTLDVTLSADRELVCRFDDTFDGARRMVATTTRDGKAQLALMDGDERVDPGKTLAVSGRESLVLGQAPRLRVRNPDSAQGLDVSLRFDTLSTPMPQPGASGSTVVPWGFSDHVIDPGELKRFILPAGDKSIRLGIGRGAVALPDAAPGPLWAADGARDATWITSSTEVAIAAETTAPVRFELVPHAATPRSPLRIETPASRGTLIVDLATLAQPNKTPRSIQVRGARDMRVIAESGVGTGPSQRFHGAGRVEIDHDAEPFVVWVDAARTPELETAIISTIPGTMMLSGAHTVIEIGDDPDPRHLIVDSPSALVVALERADGDRYVDLHPPGRRAYLYLPAGDAELRLWPVGVPSLDGVPLTMSTNPVIEIGEGLGPEVLLTADDSRDFVFSVTTTGTVGIGVRADNDVVSTQLRDADGRVLGAGAVHMHDLEPGSYILSLRLDRDARPTRARPVVVGLEPPDTGPPDDVIDRYRALAAESTETESTSATDADTRTETP